MLGSPRHDLLDTLRVYTAPGKKVRLGKDNDGGYILCALDGYDCFLSGGIRHDVSFEVDVLQRHPDLVCHAFDRTIELLPTPHPRIVFERRNIGAVESSEKTNLHSFLDNNENVLVKMDIEGSEYKWLASLSDEQLAAIRQLVIEFHRPPRRILWSRRNQVLSRLGRAHCLVHLHPNNVRTTYEVDGVLVPLIFEATYVRRSEFAAAPRLSSDPIPGTLDQPNLRDRPDIHLSGYPYTVGQRRRA
jgi:hypothetical protein